MDKTTDLLDRLIQAFSITSDNYSEVEVNGDMINPNDLLAEAQTTLQTLRNWKELVECPPPANAVIFPGVDEHTVADCAARFSGISQAPFKGYHPNDLIALWPEQLTDDLVEILGRPSGTWQLFAPFYRQDGVELPMTREINARDYDYVQAFFLHKVIGLHFKHGANWLTEIDAELAQLKERIIAKERD